MATTLVDPQVLGRSIAALLSAAAALPRRNLLGAELDCVNAAAARGYFLPDEEEMIRQRYSQYMALRAAMLETHAELAVTVGLRRIDWLRQLPVFVLAFAARCVLDRADRYLVELAAERPVVWQKLDEEDPRSGLPRKSFTRIYEEFSSPLWIAKQVMAADFYFKCRKDILALRECTQFAPVVELMMVEEPGMDHWLKSAVRRRLSYRWFSFLRRHRSAWKQVTFGLFEASGRAVAELRVPGAKPSGAPKRIDPTMRGELLQFLQPGDVVVTRHDDALSNWFLPGFWPHAALYLGTSADLATLSGGEKAPAGEGPWFLESKKDGVKIRSAAETLQVDALVALRGALNSAELKLGLERALSHEGKPYDFLFDFRTADRMVCTEVIYRGFHGIGPVKFELKEVGGRLCLPAEKFLEQALACGYQVMATAGLRGNCVRSGSDAEQAYVHAQEESI